MANLTKKIISLLLSLWVADLSASHFSLAAPNVIEFEQSSAVGNHDLALVRGGFVGTGGLEISLGIVKAVFVDGMLQTTSTLTIPDLASLMGVTPVQVSNMQSDSAVFIQNTGNLIVVQNALDQKTIQNTTIIDATVNSVSLMRQLNLMVNMQQLRTQFH